jgi:hypothetical protein
MYIQRGEATKESYKGRAKEKDRTKYSLEDK